MATTADSKSVSGVEPAGEGSNPSGAAIIDHFSNQSNG